MVVVHCCAAMVKVVVSNPKWMKLTMYRNTKVKKKKKAMVVVVVLPSCQTGNKVFYRTTINIINSDT